MTPTAPLRVRFAPSPTGHLHVGGARTALFNWLLARKTGGTFILRFEDTDTARNVAGAPDKIMADLRWLGLQWDEGVDVGGPNGPYFQSQRRDLYAAAVRKLLDTGHAYHAFDTSEELDAMRSRAEAEKRSFSYPRPATFPDESDVRKAREAGRPVVVRFTAPSEDVTVHDEVMGPVTVPSAELDDFIIVKADGMPTFHMANVVDDHGMNMSLVMRGQEFLGQTPRHIALQRALGYPTPRYAHLPLIMDMQGRKLSKRDGDVEVHAFRRAGYLPEALANFLALLGWSPGTRQEKFTLAELVDAFSIDRIGRSNPKFDRDKLLAFNTDAAASLDADRLLDAFNDYLSLNPDSPFARANLDDDTKRQLLEVNRGFRAFPDLDAKSGFIYLPDDAITYDPQAVTKVLAKDDHAGYRVLERIIPDLESLDPWTKDRIESVIQAFCERNALGMGKIAQPIRVAVSGSTVSPGIGDTLALLGRDRTLARIRRCLAQEP